MVNNMGKKAGPGVKITGLVSRLCSLLTGGASGQDAERFLILKSGEIYLPAEKSNKNVGENCPTKSKYS